MIEKLIKDFQHKLVIQHQGEINEAIHKSFIETIKENFEEVSYYSEIDMNRPPEQIKGIEKRAEEDCFYRLSETIKENNLYKKDVLDRKENNLYKKDVLDRKENPTLHKYKFKTTTYKMFIFKGEINGTKLKN